MILTRASSSYNHKFTNVISQCFAPSPEGIRKNTPRGGSIKATRGSPQHIYQPTPKLLQRKQFHRYKKKNGNFSCRSLLQSHVSTGSWCVCSTANGRLHDRIHKVSVSRFPGRLHMHVQAVKPVAMRKIRPREVPDLR